MSLGCVNQSKTEKENSYKPRSVLWKDGNQQYHEC